MRLIPLPIQTTATPNPLRQRSKVFSSANQRQNSGVAAGRKKLWKSSETELKSSLDSSFGSFCACPRVSNRVSNRNSTIFVRGVGQSNAGIRTLWEAVVQSTSLHPSRKFWFRVAIIPDIVISGCILNQTIANECTAIHNQTDNQRQ